MVSRGKALIVECDRCGNQQPVERASRFREEDYYELWHEYMGAEAEIVRLNDRLLDALADVERLRWLLERLEAPTLEQIELRALRAQLEAPPPVDSAEFADSLEVT